MKRLVKKHPKRRNAFVQTYEREGSHGGDWEYVLTGEKDEDGNPTYIKVCVVDWWDIWDDCTP